MSKKVLWLSHFLPYPATGHGALQRSHHLLREAGRRHEVHLVTLAPPVADVGARWLAEARDALLEHVASVTIVPHRRGRGTPWRAMTAAACLVRGRSFWHEWFWEPAAARAVAERVRRGVELAHFDTVLLARYAPLVGALPLALNHHNVESHLLHRRAGSGARGAARAYFHREARKVEEWERTLAAAAGTNLVVSALDGERLQALVPAARTHVVANGVDVEFFGARRQERPVPKRLVFAGGMDWFPNRDAMEHLAQELWPALVADEPERSLTVIGRAPPPAITALAAADPRVEVRGFVDDVRPHVAAASAYVCPIRVGGGTRLKILDALAMGRPLVSTRLGVEGIGLRAEEHYLEAETAGEFARQLRRLDEDPGLAADLAERGRRFVVERYAWRRIGEELAAAYEAAAATTASARSGASLPLEHLA